MIVLPDDVVLVTGATGFIGKYVVRGLLKRGVRRIRVFVRSTSDCSELTDILRSHDGNIEIVRGSLLSPDDCAAASEHVSVIYHLAASRGTKAPSEAFLNTVVTTRNLLEAVRQHGCLKRFVAVSSFAVYSNADRSQSKILDESAAVENRAHRRGDAYSFAKIKQEEIVREYGRKYSIPYVIVRPGVVYGPGNEAITGRVGLGTFGLFLHLGGANAIPFSYVENCADAIVLAGLAQAVDGEVFNILDDDQISSRQFLRLYKRNVRKFSSVYIPHAVSYLLCYLWEKYAQWSHDQLPGIYNRAVWRAYWKKADYSNAKVKTRLGWQPKISAREGLDLYFASCRRRQTIA